MTTLFHTGSLRFAGGEGAQRRSGQRIFGTRPKSRTPKDRAFSGAHMLPLPPAEETQAAQAAGKRRERVGAERYKHDHAPGAEELVGPKCYAERGSVKRAAARRSQPEWLGKRRPREVRR